MNKINKKNNNKNNQCVYNLRKCPNCQLFTLKGMPGGRDSTCKNCGYKDPCCYD